MAEPNSSLTRLFTFRFPLLHPRTPPEGGNVPSFATEGLDQAELPGIDESFPIDPAVLHAHLLDLVLRLQALLQDSCGWMEQGDIEFVGEHPADAGGVADVRVGKMGNREVAIKSYRSHSSSDHLPIYARFYNEALVCSRLRHQNIVPFVGMYSTPEHPLALVFDLMDHSNLGLYLRNNGNTVRLELLLEIARGVEYMHELNVVHGNLNLTNILVDSNGHARVAGLGMAYLSSPMSGMDVGVASGLVRQRFGLTNPGATKAGDVYAFGALAFEMFTGRAPFVAKKKVATIRSRLNGRRVPRPELPSRVRRIINGCLETVPSRRKTIAEVVVALDAERNPY